jgi:hypothetical protein
MTFRTFVSARLTILISKEHPEIIKMLNSLKHSPRKMAQRNDSFHWGTEKIYSFMRLKLSLMLTVFVSLHCFGVDTTEKELQELLEKAKGLGACTESSDCLDTGSEDLKCPTLCRDCGIVINKKNEEAFKVLERRAKAIFHGHCPMADCEPPTTICIGACVSNNCVGRQQLRNMKYQMMFDWPTGD